MWLLAALTVTACVWLARRRHRVHRRSVFSRTEYHEAVLEFVTETLADEDVCSLLVERRVFTPSGILTARESAGQGNEPWVRAIAARITQDRVVRRRLAGMLASRRGEDKHVMMKMLMEMAEVVR